MKHHTPSLRRALAFVTVTDFSARISRPATITGSNRSFSIRTLLR
jgi:hypothetical protein